MFGYVKADKAEMKVREYEYYCGVYCGLCRALGKCGGQCARLTLSYDFAFMALVRMAIEGKAPTFKLRRCMVHPVKKRHMAELNDDLSFCAAASILLSYHKTRDDITDEKGMKRFVAKFVRPYFSVIKRRPSKQYKCLEKSIAEHLCKLSEYERTCVEPSIDLPAEIFGDILAEIMSFGFVGKNEKIAKTIGKHIGKWIYIVDAVDDYRLDKDKKRFNPIVQICAENEITATFGDALETALTYELMEAEKAFDLIDYPNRDMKEIISNIIYIGMPEVAKTTLAKAVRKEDE